MKNAESTAHTDTDMLVGCLYSSCEKFSPSARIKLSNLPLDITADEIRELLQPYGEVGEIDNPTPNQSADSTATPTSLVTIVTMDYRHSVIKAIEALNDSKLRAHTLLVCLPDTHVIWVGDLAPHVTDECLKKAFAQFGYIEQAKVATDPLTGRSRGYGFIQYRLPSSIRKAVTKATEQLFLISSSTRPVRVKHARLMNVLDGMRSSQDAQDEPAPHLATPNSLEFDRAVQWRELQQRQAAEEAELAKIHQEQKRLLLQKQENYFREQQARRKGPAHHAHGAAPFNSPGAFSGDSWAPHHAYPPHLHSHPHSTYHDHAWAGPPRPERGLPGSGPPPHHHHHPMHHPPPHPGMPHGGAPPGAYGQPPPHTQPYGHPPFY